MDAQKIVYAIIGITVGVIVISTVLIPQINTYTASGAAAESYAGLLSVVIIMAIIAVVMMAVRLMGKSRN